MCRWLTQWESTYFVESIHPICRWEFWFFPFDKLEPYTMLNEASNWTKIKNRRKIHQIVPHRTRKTTTLRENKIFVLKIWSSTVAHLFVANLGNFSNHLCSQECLIAEDFFVKFQIFSFWINERVELATTCNYFPNQTNKQNSSFIRFISNRRWIPFE